MAKKQIKNRKKISLSEGFLDGEEELTQTAEEVAPELPQEDDPENVEPSEPNDDIEPDVDPAEEPDTDDTVPAEEDKEETGVETGVESEEETSKDTLDAIQTLTTAVQELSQKIDDMNTASQEPAEEPIEAEPALEEPAEDEGDEETSSEETSEEGESEESGSEENSSEESSEEGGEESGNEDEDFAGSDDSSEESSEEEETTSESLIKSFTEPGKALNEDSSYLIGKIYHNRFDKLEPIIMGIVKAKLRNRIDGARTEFRAQSFKQTYGK